MPPTPPFIVLDVPLEVEDEHGDLVPVTVEMLRGNTILHGTIPPVSAEGQEGDFYLDTVTAALYGPKGATTWPGSPISLIGPPGEITAESVTTADLHAEAVTTAKIANLAVTAAKLGAEAVETGKLKNGAVTEPKLAEEAVGTSKIANGAVTAAKLGAEAVETGAIKAAAVTTAKIAAGAITGTQMGAESVATGALVNLAVTTAKLGEGSVTAAKLGAEAVETAAIKAAAVTEAKLGAEAVSTAKIANEAVTEAKLALGIRKKKFREGHTFVVQGSVTVITIPGMFVPVVAGQEAKLVGVRYKIESGTQVKFRLQKNAANITGFGTEGEPLKATTVAATTEPAAVALANNDLLTIVISAVEGTPVGLAVTLYVETIC